MKKEITRPAWRNNVCSMSANEWGQIVSTWGETSSQRTSVGRKCLLIICVGVSADRLLGGKGVSPRIMSLTCLSPVGMKHTVGRRRMKRGWKSQVVWGHSEETQHSEKKSEKWARETQMGRKTVTEGRRESCHFPPPLSLCLFDFVGSAVVCWGEITKA